MEQSRYRIGIAAAMSIFVMMVLPCNCLPIYYPVGNSGWWNPPEDFTTWASSKKFATGDKLVFKSLSKLYDVLEVSEKAYDSCSPVNALKSYAANSTVTLDSPGTKYFICGTDCAQGMKFKAAVSTVNSLRNDGTETPPTTPTSATPTSAAVAASYMKIMDGVVLVGSLVVGALAVRML